MSGSVNMKVHHRSHLEISQGSGDEADKLILVTEESVEGTSPAKGIPQGGAQVPHGFESASSVSGISAGEQLAQSPDFVRSNRVGEFQEAWRQGGGQVVPAGETVRFVSPLARKQELIAILSKKDANADDPNDPNRPEGV